MTNVSHMMTCWRKEKLYVKNLDILAKKIYRKYKIWILLIFSIASFMTFYLRYLKKSINSSINVILVIINSKVILGQFLSSPNLLGAQVFHIHKKI